MRHFRDQHVAASLRNRNRANITVLMREQRPYPIWFGHDFPAGARARAIRYSVNIALSLTHMKNVTIYGISIYIF